MAFSGSLDYAQSSNEQGGSIKQGPIFNISSVGNIGTVKMLAIAGVAWLFIRLFKKK